MRRFVLTGCEQSFCAIVMDSDVNIASGVKYIDIVRLFPLLQKLQNTGDSEILLKIELWSGSISLLVFVVDWTLVSSSIGKVQPGHDPAWARPSQHSAVCGWIRNRRWPWCRHRRRGPASTRRQRRASTGRLGMLPSPSPTSRELGIDLGRRLN